MKDQHKISFIYKDNDLIVVDKPINLPVHKNDFMPNDAPYLTKLIGEITGKWIYNVHRLDSKTSGLIILAFSSEVAHKLTVQFEKKEVKKTYFAVVRENPGEGIFNEKVVVKKKTKFKKPAVTHFKTIKSLQTNISYKDYKNICLSLVEVKPETGRWHQIRQHFAKNRFDIIGDTHHGDFTLNKIILEKIKIKRLFLHAGELMFTHPVSGEKIKIEAALPKEFEILFNSLIY